METWLDLARNCRKSATHLISAEFNRSAISRAYYAVYSKVTMELLNCGVSMPADREGPSHKKLRPLVESSLSSMDREKRLALSRIIGRLYTMRLAADYLPSFAMEAGDAREAIALMKKAFEAF